MSKRAFLVIFLIFASFFASASEASVIVLGTRFVFPAEDREISIRLENPEKTPALLQIWFDDGNENSRGENVPLNALPPLFKMQPKSSQRVRIVQTQSDLPKDRESIFYVNILEIPPKPKFKQASGQNYLQFSIRSRFKIFYRPKLKMSRDQAEKNIQWRLVQKGKQVLLQAKNTSPYFVTLSELNFSHNKKKYAFANVFMLAPFATTNLKLENFNLPVSVKGKVFFTSINDYGGKTKFSSAN